ncbi:delta and Notch-like epidermal growth factor-related receptor [Mytilus trossulus]|uniref:delta and Notch-like epidermal growth factor-related receptor n=1 Tax=Mytilus trossulus TaxID=6551 RepID=UPI0030045A67
MVIVIYIAAGVEGVDIVYGGKCATNGDCTEANNVCAATKCACSPTSYKTDGTNKCVQKIDLGGSCTATPTGQCADPNAECDGKALTCVCNDNYFENKESVCASQVTTIDHNCDSTETSEDQCSVADTECRNDGAGSKCLCKTSHFKDGTTCTIRKKPEETCTADQCVIHATCNTTSNLNKCKCNAGYTATPTTTPTMCSGVTQITSVLYMLALPIFVSLCRLR